MGKHHLSDKSERIYRVDKFVVPGRAREEFSHEVRRTSVDRRKER
jgi:hypothetical protein